jgi:dipeptidyl aminopeptidase/acylaminoacyl peptidase
MQIPIELLTAGRDLTEPRLSPDGTVVAFVQKWRGKSAILVVPVEGGPERAVTLGPDPAAGRGLGGGCFAWHPDSDGVLYAAVDGEIWWQPIGGAPEPMTSLGRECRAPSVAPNAEHFVFAVDEAEVWGLHMQRAEPTRLDDGTDAFCFDPVVSPASSTVSWQGWSPPDMPWDGAVIVSRDLKSSELTRSWPGQGESEKGESEKGETCGAAQQPRFMPDGQHLWVDDSSGWLNVRIDGEPVLAEPSEHAGPTWGMGQRSFVSSPDGTKIALCRNEAGFGRLVVVDRATGEVTNVGKGGHGQLHWVGDTLTALRTGAVTPTQIVAYDLSDLSVKPPRTVLAVGPAAGWDRFELPEPTVIQTTETAQTGSDVALHARRYAAGEGRMLVWVHGGPTDQWQADFRPRISYWWSRGWDVLVVDPRGTTGHGRDYQRGLNGAWGRIDVDDTAALIRHAHVEGWAAPDTTVVIGGSSGGLTVLGVLADHSDIVAGGVASYPVSDLRSLAEVTHRFEAHYTDTLVGDAADIEHFDALSPLYRADRITQPLLVFHGSEDPVVPLAQSEQLVERAGPNVELVVYEGEGHGFRDPQNVRDEYERTQAFLAANVLSWHL